MFRGSSLNEAEMLALADDLAKLGEHVLRLADMQDDKWSSGQAEEVVRRLEDLEDEYGVELLAHLTELFEQLPTVH